MQLNQKLYITLTLASHSTTSTIYYQLCTTGISCHS